MPSRVTDVDIYKKSTHIKNDEQNDKTYKSQLQRRSSNYSPFSSSSHCFPWEKDQLGRDRLRYKASPPGTAFYRLPRQPRLSCLFVIRPLLILPLSFTSFTSPYTQIIFFI